MGDDITLKELKTLENITSEAPTTNWWTTGFSGNETYDWFLEHRKEQVGNMTTILKNLVKSGDLNEDFTLLDMCSAEGSRGCILKEHFPNAKFYAFDIKEFLISRNEVKNNGVDWFKIDLRHLLESNTLKFDVLCMINSYRGFMGGSSSMQDKKNQVDTWVNKSGNFLMWTQKATGGTEDMNMKLYEHVETVTNPKTMTLHCYKIRR